MVTATTDNKSTASRKGVEGSGIGTTGTIKAPVAVCSTDCTKAFVQRSVNGVAWVVANGNKQPKTIGANFNDFRIFPSYSGRFY